MNPHLCILKARAAKDFTARKCIRFAIVDQDRDETYPANFVCILPQHMSPVNMDSSVFAKTFKEKRIEVAKRLLTEALQKEADPLVRKEIKQRLTQLAPKPIW